MCTLAWSQLKSAFEWYICSSGAAERDGRRLVINVPKSLLFYTEPRLNSHKKTSAATFFTDANGPTPLRICRFHVFSPHWFGLKLLLTGRRGRKTGLNPS